MDNPTPSIKCKMMQDAGYTFPEPWPAYVMLVDFVKGLAEERTDLNNNLECICEEARVILKKIGE
jgi:hypothetical protein